IREDAGLWEQDREFYRRASAIAPKEATLDARQAIAQGRWARTIARSLAPHLLRDETDAELVVVSETFAPAFRAARLIWHSNDPGGSFTGLLGITLPLAEASYLASTLPRRSLLLARDSAPDPESPQPLS